MSHKPYTRKEIADIINNENIKIVSKNESILMKTISVILFFTNFMDSWTVIGKTIYTPGDLNIYDYPVVFEHELVHMEQREKYGFLFYILYLFFPLPFFFSYFRFKFEAEAYMVNIQYAENKEEMILWVSKTLSSSAYGWSWPQKKIEKALRNKLGK